MNRICLATAVALWCGAAPASAAIFTDRLLFDGRVRTAATETFESFATGDKGGTFRFSTATATATVAAPNTVSVSNSALFCRGNTGNCLIGDPVGARTFNSFAAGTTAFGFDLAALGQLDQFTVTAVTGSGTQTYTVSGASRFVGLSDVTGLLSVSIANLGSGASTSNYGLDNLSTGVVLPPANQASFTSRASFLAEAPVGVVAETFESFATGDKGGTFRFSNATVTATAPNTVSVSSSALFCRGNTGNCLIGDPVGARTFGDFAAGTTGFGFDLAAISQTDRFSITAVTGSGTRNYAITGASRFFGLTDVTGLLSVSIANLGSGASTSNYGLDNVTTFLAVPQAAAVPEPATWGLMLAGFGLVGVGARTRRRAARVAV